MSAPFNKPKVKPPHPWIGPVQAPKGHDFRQWKGESDKRCEYKYEAAEYRDKAARALESRHNADAACLSLDFKNCWDEEPCYHPLEALCARRLRINFVGRASKALTVHCPGKRLWSVTLVFKEGKFWPGELHKASMTEIVKIVRRKLKKAGLGHRKIIGAVDASYNENSHKTWKPHWQLHVHFVLVGSTKEKLFKRLKKAFPATDTIKKPVDVAAVYDLMGALSYTCKSYFERRVSYINSKGHWDARSDLGLKPEQFREAALFMATQDVSSRFLFQGFRRRGRFLEPTS